MTEAVVIWSLFIAAVWTFSCWYFNKLGQYKGEDRGIKWANDVWRSNG
jgi:hypothetical protein